MRPILLWDVMDTVVRDPFPTAMLEFLGVSLDTLLREKHPTAWIDFETGLLDEEQFAARFYADGRGIDGRALLQHVRRHYRYVDGMQALLSELKSRGAVMHTLSNYPTWYRVIEAELKLSQYMPWTFVSCLTGLRKPETATFQRAAAALQAAPQSCVLIDDRRVNCESARSTGMRAIHFTGDVAALRTALTDVGAL